MTEPIQREVANHVLWAFTDWNGYPSEGYRPGSFVRKLIELINAADPDNRRILRPLYGQYVAAIELCEMHGGLDVLRVAANPASFFNDDAQDLLAPDHHLTHPGATKLATGGRPFHIHAVTDGVVNEQPDAVVVPLRGGER